MRRSRGGHGSGHACRARASTSARTLPHRPSAFPEPTARPGGAERSPSQSREPTRRADAPTRAVPMHVRAPPPSHGRWAPPARPLASSALALLAAQDVLCAPLSERGLACGEARSTMPLSARGEASLAARRARRRRRCARWRSRRHHPTRARRTTTWALAAAVPASQTAGQPPSGDSHACCARAHAPPT